MNIPATALRKSVASTLLFFSSALTCRETDKGERVRWPGQLSGVRETKDLRLELEHDRLPCPALLRIPGASLVPSLIVEYSLKKNLKL